MPEMLNELRGNWARRQPPPVRDGTVIQGVNLSQAEPNTVLANLAGRPLTFRGCNLVNVAVDPAWTVEHCNTAQVVIPPPPTPEEEKQAEIERLLGDRTDINERLKELGYIEVKL